MLQKLKPIILISFVFFIPLISKGQQSNTKIYLSDSSVNGYSVYDYFSVMELDSIFPNLEFKRKRKRTFFDSRSIGGGKDRIWKYSVEDKNSGLKIVCGISYEKKKWDAIKFKLFSDIAFENLENIEIIIDKEKPVQLKFNQTVLDTNFVSKYKVTTRINNNYNIISLTSENLSYYLEKQGDFIAVQVYGIPCFFHKQEKGFVFYKTWSGDFL